MRFSKSTFCSLLLCFLFLFAGTQEAFGQTKLNSKKKKLSYATGVLYGTALKQMKLDTVIDVSLISQTLLGSLGGKSNSMTTEEANAVVMKGLDGLKENGKTPKDLSKAYGLVFGDQLKKQFIFKLVPELLEKGFEDTFAGTAQMDKKAATKVFASFGATNKKKIAADKALKEAENLKAANTFLAENRFKEGVKETESGLQYIVLNKGKGASAKRAKEVIVHYKGYLPSGEEFDSSHKRGKPTTFNPSMVIPGWTEALKMMRVGDKWQLFIPPHLAYQEDGAGGLIGPNQLLIFEVEMIGVELGF